MPTLYNQGTLRFTPALGGQSTIISNTTSTDLEVTYGLEVSHGASPVTFGTGDTIVYTVILCNTGSGILVLPEVTVDLGDGALSYVEGSATAFLYDGAEVSEYPFTVSNGSVIFSFTDPIPAGGIVILVYSATVNAAAGDSIVSTATATASEGVATGPVRTDSDTATITRAPVTIVKTAPASAEVGETIQFRFTVTNNTNESVILDDLADQLPAQFNFTSLSLIVDGVNVPLTAGTDYDITPDGLLTVDPAAPITLDAGETAVYTVTGVVSA